MAFSKKPPHPIDVHVGSRIRSGRNMIDMSQATLADALHLTFQQVQKYEKGTNRISSSKLQLIANTLGREVAWFFEGAPEPTKNKGDAPPDPCQQLGTTRDGVALARAFNAVRNPQMRQAILAIAEAAAS
jgi:transcriptional regulator with XRE-family HTH domain